jgi:hypothetical protein
VKKRNSPVKAEAWQRGCNFSVKTVKRMRSSSKKQKIGSIGVISQSNLREKRNSSSGKQKLGRVVVISLPKLCGGAKLIE